MCSFSRRSNFRFAANARASSAALSSVVSVRGVWCRQQPTHCKTLSLQEGTRVPCRAKHIQSTFALFHNQPEVLFSFICKVD
jgi:hypothetical protein